MQFIGNRYDILNYEGDIEVGKFYKARDTYYNNIVYIKLINKVDELKKEFIPDLIDESTVLSQIKSQQIGKILHTDVHCSEFDVYYYVVSEYFEGISLKEYIYRNNLSKGSIVNICMKIVRALEVANINHLYHGSLNTSNILINDEEEIKIYDFGLVKANKGRSIPSNKDIIYLCPHQLNINYTDIESDMFSFGIILFEMLFREFPFEISYNKREMLKNMDKGIKWSLLIYEDDFSELIKIAQKLLDRKLKYKSMSEILVDLTHVIYEEVDLNKYDEVAVSIVEENHKRPNYSKSVFLGLFVVLMTIIIIVGNL